MNFTLVVQKFLNGRRKFKKIKPEMIDLFIAK
jgi:hypothetical protein